MKHNESAGANMLLKSYVMKLLLIILRNSSLNANFRDKLNQDNLEIKVERICEYLKHNYTRPVKVEEIADYFKISRSYFHAVFLKYTGLTMTQYINRMRCSSAIKLLQTTDYPLEKVSELSGFGSVCSLYQRMKLDTGHPVNFYRNKRCKLPL